MKYLLLLLLCAPAMISAQIPERVILNLTAEPAVSMAVTWRAADERTDACVQYAEATQWTQFTTHLSTAHALLEKADTEKGERVFHYSAVVKNLVPGTRYVYRVGRDSAWSEWNQFSTSSDEAAPFSFVFFGDPQDDLTEHCSRMFRQAFQTAGTANFWLFSGDITSEPEDKQIGEFFTAAGFPLRTTPSVLAPGNHDRGFLIEDGKIVRNKKGKKERITSISPLWHAHYTLPENGIPGFREVSYTFDYQGVRFIMLNTNDRIAEQAAWMETLLAGNPNKWTVVAFHHPIYSMGRARDDQETRMAFQPVFDKYHVDLVLTGHDHTYARSHKINGGKAVADTAQGTVYVLSVSGPKQYEVNSGYQDLMAKIGGNAQLFQVISVSGDTIEYRSYTAAGVLFDECTLTKK